MIDYFIKINYILSYTRYKKIKRFLPEYTCLILTDLEIGNLGILSIYFVGIILGHYSMLKSNYYTLYFVILILFYIWAHFMIDKKIKKAEFKKQMKKISEKDKIKYSRLAIMYLILSTLLWVLAFTWPVILYGKAAMAPA